MIIWRSSNNYRKEVIQCLIVNRRGRRHTRPGPSPLARPMPTKRRSSGQLAAAVDNGRAAPKGAALLFCPEPGVSRLTLLPSLKDCSRPCRILGRMGVRVTFMSSPAWRSCRASPLAPPIPIPSRARPGGARSRLQCLASGERQAVGLRAADVAARRPRLVRARASLQGERHGERHASPSPRLPPSAAR